MNKKLGIVLPSAVSLMAGVAAYMPRPAEGYNRRRERDTYEASLVGPAVALADRMLDVAQYTGITHIVLTGGFLPGETPRQPLDRITNLAQLFNFPQPPPPSAAGCVGVTQTFTATGTFTSSCTGTLTMQAWGPGAKAANSGSYSGQGGGAFASSNNISVTNGQTWLATVPASANVQAFTVPSFICPTANAACVSGTIASCVGTYTGLSITNFVCAANGQRSAVNSSTGGLGGTTAASLGVTLFKGGNGGSASGVAAGGGGGSAGPDGAGNNGTTTAGGSGDAGSGGAGGTYGAGGVANGGPGGSNVNGGGGGGGANNFYIGGAGGVPGGGDGGRNTTSNSRGQIIVHSDASDVLTPVLTVGSGYGGGTVSTA